MNYRRRVRHGKDPGEHCRGSQRGSRKGSGRHVKAPNVQCHRDCPYWHLSHNHRDVMLRRCRCGWNFAVCLHCLEADRRKECLRCFLENEGGPHE